MNIYRIYTEDLDTNQIAEVIEAAGFNSFTILQGVGYWMGEPEAAVVIEIIQTEAARHDILELAEALRLELDQEAVLVTTQKLDGFKIVESPKEQTKTPKEVLV